MRFTKFGLVVGAAALFVGGVAYAAENWGPHQVGDKRSGYTFAQPETRAMQDDDFANPAFLLVDQAEEIWTKKEGDAGKSCADCHHSVTSMKGVATRYPAFDEKLGKPITIQQRINMCRKENMKAPEWKWESPEMLGTVILVKMQSRGMPINVSVDGPLKPFYEKGKAFYYERRGQLDLACINCHSNDGANLRANVLSQGQPNGFPTYRLKWSGVGSLHRRIRGCNTMVRAEPYKAGSDEYVNLEVFLMNRANGLPIETPSVRN